MTLKLKVLKVTAAGWFWDCECKPCTLQIVLHKLITVNDVKLSLARSYHTGRHGLRVWTFRWHLLFMWCTRRRQGLFNVDKANSCYGNRVWLFASLNILNDIVIFTLSLYSSGSGCVITMLSLLFKSENWLTLCIATDINTLAAKLTQRTGMANDVSNY